MITTYNQFPVRLAYTTSATTDTAGSIYFDPSLTTTGSMWNLQPWPALPAPAPSVGRPPGFNRYVNASDLLEDFIRFLGEEGVRQGEVMGLPVELFIKWLIIKACEHDGEEPNVTLQLPSPKAQPRCLGCQRFLPGGTAIPIHDQRCAGFFFARQQGMKKPQRSYR